MVEVAQWKGIAMGWGRFKLLEEYSAGNDDPNSWSRNDGNQNLWLPKEQKVELRQSDLAYLVKMVNGKQLHWYRMGSTCSWSVTPFALNDSVFEESFSGYVLCY